MCIYICMYIYKYIYVYTYMCVFWLLLPSGQASSKSDELSSLVPRKPSPSARVCAWASGVV